MKRALMMVVALAALDPQRSSKPCTNCGRLTVRRARRNESYPIARSRGSTLAERYSCSFTSRGKSSSVSYEVTLRPKKHAVPFLLLPV